MIDCPKDRNGNPYHIFTPGPNGDLYRKTGNSWKAEWFYIPDVGELKDDDGYKVKFKWNLDEDLYRKIADEDKTNLDFYTKKDEDVLATAFKTFKKYANKDEEVSKIAHFDIHKVIKSGNAVIVFWSPKEKTVVRLKDDDTDDIYSAVAQAIAKRMYSSTSKFHKMIDKALVEQKEK